MKKLLLILLVLCFSLTGCAQSEDEALKEAEQLQSQIDDIWGSDLEYEPDYESSDDAFDTAENIGVVTEKTASDLVDLLTEDASWQAQAESLKEQGILCTLEARGNTFVYVYQYTIDLPDLTTIKTGLDATKDTLKSLADSFLRAYSGVDSVVFEYRAKDGTFISSYEFN